MEKNFYKEKTARITSYANDNPFIESSQKWVYESMKKQYVYNFDWLGRPIIQYPQDMVAIQELIWKVKPDLIIETGVAHGGSLVLSASMLALLDMSEAIEEKRNFNPIDSSRKVIGIDIDIREHNKVAIESHPMANWIHMIEGSSVAPNIIKKVNDIAKKYKNIMVFLDSNHTYEHVLAELNAFAPLVSVESYCVVFDTFVEDMPVDLFPNRPWAPGNSPKTAVCEYIKKYPKFEIDNHVFNKLLISVAPDGYLKRII